MTSPTILAGLKINKRWPTWVCLLVLALVYCFGRSVHIPFGDGLGFALSATDPNLDLSTNATSHLFYQVLLYIGVRILPFGLPTSLWFVSAVFALLTLWQLDQIYHKLRLAIMVRLGLMLGLGLSFTFWRHAEIPEVYTFYWFCLVVQWRLLFWLMDVQATQSSYLPWGRILVCMLWAGLTLMVHIGHLLLVPTLLLSIVLRCRQFGLVASVRALVVGVLTLLIVASPLVLLPMWRLSMPLNEALMDVLFDRMHQKTILNADPFAFLKGSVIGVGLYIYNFGLLGGIIVVSIVLSVRQYLKSNTRWAIFSDGKLVLLVTSLGLHLAYVCRFPNLQVQPFYGPAYLTTFILLAYLLSLQQTAKLLDRQQVGLWGKISSIADWRLRTWALLIVSQPLVYGLVFGELSSMISQPQVMPALQPLKQFADQKAYKGGLAYYLLPWQPDQSDALKTVRTITAKVTLTPTDSLIIKDTGYNWEQGLILAKRLPLGQD